ncbi:MAG TPA: hypothetical protein VJ521_00415 [Acidobacteriota bacterium]|nr:hypothetical protein [Acidobacteriota bacterium]
MTNVDRFYFDGLALTLSTDSYLVEVKRIHYDPPYINTVWDLPDWVFNSRLAIWITEESASIYHRSLAGEQIRNELLMLKGSLQAG